MINVTDDINNDKLIISYPKPLKYVYFVKPVVYFFDSCYYLLRKTQNRWLLRVTDDVFVDIFELQKYISHLETIYDPLKHIVIKGEQITEYLHGGAGYLISRAAAQALIELDSELRLELGGIGDDVVLGRFFYILQRDYMDTQAFSSFRIEDDSYESLSKGINHLKSCSRRLIHYPRQIAVWHAGNKNLEVVEKNHFFKKLPENVYIEVVDGKRYFCVGSKENLIKSYENEDKNPYFLTMKDIPNIIEANRAKFSRMSNEHERYYMFNH